jgi:hypothetical protein
MLANDCVRRSCRAVEYITAVRNLSDNYRSDTCQTCVLNLPGLGTYGPSGGDEGCIAHLAASLWRGA